MAHFVSSHIDHMATSAVAIEAINYGELCYLPFEALPDQADAIRSSSDVFFVAKDEQVRMSESWGLDRIDQATLPLDRKLFHPEFGGEGVEVYVLDTGVLPEHSEFGGRATFGLDVIGAPKRHDENGHGTHVAGTAAGATHGVARAAKVVAVKVLSATGYGSTLGVIRGIEWAARSGKAGRTVLSLSLSGLANEALSTAVREAAKEHVVVVAAGNNYGDACFYSPANAGGSGREYGVISVGSTTSSDALSSFSNTGPCVDIFAPGSSITSAALTGGFKTLSGTSMAAPHVSGAMAVLLQKNKYDRDAAIDELFRSAVQDEIRGLKRCDANELLFLESGRGKTLAPTVSPVPTPKISLCAGTYCVDAFAHSAFGPAVGDLVGSPVEGHLVDMRSTKGCGRINKDVKGKFVMISSGGCDGAEKVLRLQKEGAVAVLIKSRRLSEPKSSSDDQEDVVLHSAQITGPSARELVKQSKNRMVRWGVAGTF